MPLFPHHLLITRPGEGGVQDPNTGAWTEPKPVVLYDSSADVQDAGFMVRGSPDGTPRRENEADAFLSDESAVGRIRPKDDVVVTWEDGTESFGTVLRVRRLDGTVVLRWLS